MSLASLSEFFRRFNNTKVSAKDLAMGNTNAWTVDSPKTGQVSTPPAAANSWISLVFIAAFGVLFAGLKLDSLWPANPIWSQNPTIYLLSDVRQGGVFSPLVLQSNTMNGNYHLHGRIVSRARVVGSCAARDLHAKEFLTTQDVVPCKK